MEEAAVSFMYKADNSCRESRAEPGEAQDSDNKGRNILNHRIKESKASTSMDLETVIQSEVGQKEKNKYLILTYICGI